MEWEGAGGRLVFPAGCEGSAEKFGASSEGRRFVGRSGGWLRRGGGECKRGAVLTKKTPNCSLRSRLHPSRPWDEPLSAAAVHPPGADAIEAEANAAHAEPGTSPSKNGEIAEIMVKSRRTASNSEKRISPSPWVGESGKRASPHPTAPAWAKQADPSQHRLVKPGFSLTDDLISTASSGTLTARLSLYSITHNGANNFYFLFFSPKPPARRTFYPKIARRRRASGTGGTQCPSQGWPGKKGRALWGHPHPCQECPGEGGEHLGVAPALPARDKGAAGALCCLPRYEAKCKGS